MKFDRENIKIANMLKFFASLEKLAFWRYAFLILRRRNEIRSRLDEKRNTFVAFIDFEKAFDWIDRDLLLYKLLLCPIDCKFYYAIKSVYNQKYAGVKLNGHISNWFETHTGVRRFVAYAV